MSRLRIFDDTDPANPHLDTRDHAAMAAELAKINVGFEQWEATQPVVPGASQDEVLNAYRKDVDRLVADNGFKTVDVVSIKPDHPDRTMMRTKFLDEHFHKEDEVRFFVAGAGQFTLHVDGKVYEILCETGDLIHVPDGTKHWFDMGRLPSFIAIRFFTEPDGWVGHFTGSDIAQRFPFYEPNKRHEVRMSRPRAILTDIEGTTSSIAFVHDVLFPYALRALPGFVRHNVGDAAVRHWLDKAAMDIGGVVDDDCIVALLQDWIREDRKHPALKALQGMLWKDGYERGDYRGHVYPDAVAGLRRWNADGIPLHVYSSGSVDAQKLLFAHSDAGDLSGLFADHFDTAVGGKREVGSYLRIAQELGLPPAEILFLSDVVEELDAAHLAGMQTMLLDRPEDYPNPRDGTAARGHPRVTSFADIAVDRAS